MSDELLTDEKQIFEYLFNNGGISINERAWIRKGLKEGCLKRLLEAQLAKFKGYDRDLTLVKADYLIKLKKLGWKSPKEVEEVKVRGLEAGAVNERERIITYIEEHFNLAYPNGEALQALKDKP